jgi:membrane-associated protease RseP (regulator of RpoE activity)
VSLDVPLQVSAEAQPILEHAEPPEPEPAVSPDVPLQVSAEVQPILEYAEPPEPERAVSGNVYTAQKDYGRAIANYDEAIKFDPKFAVAYEEISPEDKSTVKEARPFKGSIGVTIRRVTDGAAHALNVTPARGALVVGIDENGPAEAAGIEPADVIVKVDGKDVKECRDLPRIVADTTAGKDVALTIIRKGKELTKTVKVGRLEDDVDKQASFTSKKGSAPQEEPVAVDPKSESAAKHPAPGMAIFEIQQQPVSSDPLLLVLPVPPRFGRRRFDHASKVSH